MIDVCDRLSIEKPVLQAAMGSVARQELVVSVSKAGGLGALGYLPAAEFRAELEQILDRLTNISFSANLLMPIIDKQHVQACLDLPVPIVSLFFGFDQTLIDVLKAKGKIVLFQIGSETEAARVIGAGADGVIVQGYESGGHVRGKQVLAELLPRVKEQFPNHIVCGAGGVYDADSAAKCRAMGADAVCSGTRFLASPEAAASPTYKAKLIEANETLVTNLFGMGWRDPHRVIPNAAVRKWCRPDGAEPRWLASVHAVANVAAKLKRTEDMAGLVARQNLSAPLYTPASLSAGLPDSLADVVALYAGDCVQSIHALQPAADSVAELA